MKISRRGFVKAAVATGAVMGVPRAMRAAGDGSPVLEARALSLQMVPPEFPQTAVWSFGGTVPGQEIRLRQGQRLRRRLVNRLPQATSVHWHGIRGDNAMDGVAGLTQAAVAPGAEFTYDLELRDAGTFWYHAHNRSLEQVARGLHGPLIVEEPEAPDVDADQVLVLDDWRLARDTAQIVADFDSPHDRSHAGRRGNLIVTNGQYDFARRVARYQRLRLRLINAANARVFPLALSGFRAWIIALDGMPLAMPQPVTAEILLGPGQRADLIADVIAEPGQAGYLLRLGEDQPRAQASFPVKGLESTALRDPPGPLPPNPDQAVGGLDTALRTRLNMAGGAMGRLEAAVVDGQRRDFVQMGEANQFWAFNGIVGMTDTPLITAATGQTVRVALVNDTAFPHAIHLHGMHFREIRPEGGLGPLRDTLLSFGGQRHEIAFVAGNPGDWLLHCHMLAHAEAGMMTWVKVTA